MKFVTEIYALGLDGEQHTFIGPTIESISPRLAQEWCENNGMGYCHVKGILIETIPTKSDGYTPDWDNKIEEENNLN
jgi:hypothetical protein